MQYLESKRSGNGRIISMIFRDLVGHPDRKTALFLRTPHTGGWMDSITPPPHVATTRILYTTDNDHLRTRDDVVIVGDEDVAGVLQGLTVRFDIICIDPFHEYDQSARDLALCVALLTDRGVLLCHDCRPESLLTASPFFQSGSWSGLTYAAFVRTARDHPLFHYAILDTDTGVGILSKTDIPALSVSSSLDLQKQDELLRLIETGDHVAAFAFFVRHGGLMINLISPQKMIPRAPRGGIIKKCR